MEPSCRDDKKEEHKSNVLTHEQEVLQKINNDTIQLRSETEMTYVMFIEKYGN